MRAAAARLAAVPRPVAALLAFGWAFSIHLLSSLPGSTFGEGGAVTAYLGNLFHAPLFLGLATLAGLALLERPGAAERGGERGGDALPFDARARMLGAFALAVLYGGCDEWHQSGVAGRTPDPLDLMTDAAGAWGGVVLAAMANRAAAGEDPRLRRLVPPAVLALLSAGLATAGGR